VRVCVVGAGAIGGLVAVRLAVAGNDVSVLARGDTLAAIDKTGLRLIEPDGSEVMAPGVQASDQASRLGRQDLIVLAVKAHQLPHVAPALPTLYDDETVVIPLQNGVPWWFFQQFHGPFAGRRLESLDPDGTIERSVPPERIVGSVAYPAAEREGPAAVRLIEGDRFPVGELNGERSPRALMIADLLTEGGFKSRVVTDLRSNVWIKAWGNLAFNPISALTGATLREICRDEAARAVAEKMMLEAAAIAERLGLRLRLSVSQRIEGAEKVGDHKTSMLQDVEAGRALEVEALVGAFAELGTLTDTPTPTIEVVYSLVSLLNDRLTR
jgi:2-dehydropantoate 2-reductase